MKDHLSLNAKIETARRTPLNATAYCVTHDQECPLKEADIDFSGLPCIGFSPSGQRAGLIHPTMWLFIIYAKWHCIHGTPVLILENVPEIMINNI